MAKWVDCWLVGMSDVMRRNMIKAQCEVCGATYQSMKEAKGCERQHMIDIARRRIPGYGMKRTIVEVDIGDI